MAARGLGVGGRGEGEPRVLREAREIRKGFTEEGASELALKIEMLAT